MKIFFPFSIFFTLPNLFVRQLPSCRIWSYAYVLYVYLCVNHVSIVLRTYLD